MESSKQSLIVGENPMWRAIKLLEARCSYTPRTALCLPSMISIIGGFRRGRRLGCSETDTRTSNVLHFTSQGAPDGLACGFVLREGRRTCNRGLERLLAPLLPSLVLRPNSLPPLPKMGPRQMTTTRLLVKLRGSVLWALR